MKSGKSKRNENEVNIVTLFIEKLNNCGIDFNNIGVITPYIAQKVLIQNKLIEKYKNTKGESQKVKNVKISSVDGFQGGERFHNFK
jgi:superfamily I DNA and/or RNA helicase